MAKTELTKQLEKAIIIETSQWFGCLEVTIGWYGNQRVDFMTMDSKEIFRCFEIKVTKSDFHSKHGHNFVGNFNYYVMPQELYEEVKDEIEDYIGVYVGSKYKDKYTVSLVKRSKKQELKVEKNILQNSMIRSLYRDVCKYYNTCDIEYINKLKNKINKLENENKRLYREKQDISNEYTYYKRHKDKIALDNIDIITDELKTYSEWCPILEKENSMKILDDDGGRQLERENKLNNKITKQEAFNYFIINTVEMKVF